MNSPSCTASAWRAARVSAVIAQRIAPASVGEAPGWLGNHPEHVVLSRFDDLAQEIRKSRNDAHKLLRVAETWADEAARASTDSKGVPNTLAPLAEELNLKLAGLVDVGEWEEARLPERQNALAWIVEIAEKWLHLRSSSWEPFLAWLQRDVPYGIGDK